MSLRRHSTLLCALVLAPLSVIVGLRYGSDPVALEAAQPLLHRQGGFVGSATCATCHPDQHASWARTFHRTMTQRPEPEHVLGHFDGRPVSMFGATARPCRDGDEFRMELPVAGGGTRIATVALAVGSRRYQQYFEQITRSEGTCYQRLPLVWHIGAQRWIHLNGVFLEPDDDDWSRHSSIWNENCIFCHNTAPRPGILNFAERADPMRRTYDSAVGELGIACEACHGPGARHAAANRDPLHRYASYGKPADDIVDPKRLDHVAATSLCGQCHGQRLPAPRERIETWLHTGPTFRPGEDLLDHVAPITRDTAALTAEQPELFRNRFWNDGTARLTAYEYQGVTQSPCYQRGDLSCMSCHRMHGGDVNGMIEPELRGDRACTQCHEEIGRRIEQHTGHRAASAGSRCLDCHMPRIAFGILLIHRSHRVEVPDPGRDGESGRPHACTLCHGDKTLAWSAEQMNRIWGHGTKRWSAPTWRPDQVDLSAPDAIASLLAGDAVQRAVYATAIGRPGFVVSDDQRAVMPILGIATLFDAYPSIRWLTRASLLELERPVPEAFHKAIVDFDPLAPKTSREEAARQLFTLFAIDAKSRYAATTSPWVHGDFSPALENIVPLLKLQSRRAIAIGE